MCMRNSFSIWEMRIVRQMLPLCAMRYMLFAIYHKNEMMTILDAQSEWRKAEECQPPLFYTHLFGILNIHMKIIIFHSEFKRRNWRQQRRQQQKNDNQSKWIEWKLPFLSFQFYKFKNRFAFFHHRLQQLLNYNNRISILKKDSKWNRHFEPFIDFTSNK